MLLITVCSADASAASTVALANTSVASADGSWLESQKDGENDAMPLSRSTFGRALMSSCAVTSEHYDDMVNVALSYI